MGRIGGPYVAGGGRGRLDRVVVVVVVVFLWGVVRCVRGDPRVVSVGIDRRPAARASQQQPPRPRVTAQAGCGRGWVDRRRDRRRVARVEKSEGGGPSMTGSGPGC